MQCSHCESAPSFASDFAMEALASALSVSGPAQRHLSANAARLQGVSPRAPSDASAAPRTLSLASIAVRETTTASAVARQTVKWSGQQTAAVLLGRYTLSKPARAASIPGGVHG